MTATDTDVTRPDRSRPPLTAPLADRAFASALRAAMVANESLLCVGLDPDLSRFPTHLRGLPPADAIVHFNAAIIEATSDLVCAYKPNLGFYLAHGLDGIRALVATRELVPGGIPVILDAKVQDIGHTAEAYARGYLDGWDFAAVTAGGFLGEDSLAPFLDRAERGVFVLCKTSNPGGGEFQNLVVGRDDETTTELYLLMAERTLAWAQRHPASVGMVVGATYPGALAAVRARCPGLPILLPGVGAQAGDLTAAVQAGAEAGPDANLLVSASRSVIYAHDGVDFADHARAVAAALRNEINEARVPAT